MIKNISNLGDAALYCDFGTEVNKEINTKVIQYFKSIQQENISQANFIFNFFAASCIFDPVGTR